MFFGISLTTRASLERIQRVQLHPLNYSNGCSTSILKTEIFLQTSFLVMNFHLQSLEKHTDQHLTYVVKSISLPSLGTMKNYCHALALRDTAEHRS